MSQQEMDQMDREVMALVNDRRMEQEIATEPAAPRNDTGDEGERTATPPATPRNDGEEDTTSVTADPSNDRSAGTDWRESVKEKEGRYYISKEDFAALDAAAKRARKIRNGVYMAVCAGVIAGLIATYCRPELLSYLVATGVVGCSVAIGVCLARLVEVKR